MHHALYVRIGMALSIYSYLCNFVLSLYIYCDTV